MTMAAAKGRVTRVLTYTISLTQAFKHYHNPSLLTGVEGFTSRRYHASSTAFRCNKSRYDKAHNFFPIGSTYILDYKKISSQMRAALMDRNKGSATNFSTTKIISNDESNLIQDMLGRIRSCNAIPDDLVLMDFVVDGKKVGRVTPEMADYLVSASEPPIFEVDNGDVLTLTSNAGDTCESRTSSVMAVMIRLREENMLEGWRDELYPVKPSFDCVDPPLFNVERAAARVLGVLEYGVHINGLVRNDKDARLEPKMWIARRSKTKSKYPGMLDHIVAGGQPSGISLIDNVVKECGEEAGIPPSLAKQAFPTGAISYESQVNFGGDRGLRGVERVILFCYDLFLPPDFVPKVVDGEVDEFFLWDMAQVRESMSPDFHDPIKPNCYLVIIDYLMRMGFLGTDAGADSCGYLDILRELRSGKCQ